MTKLYFPTTTLNFTNIFSTESVSPFSFYKRRKFGFARFFQLPGEHLQNSFLLFDAAFNFELFDVELETHPMLIEFEFDDQKFTQLTECSPLPGIKRYLCGHTLYLDPCSTKLYFSSDKDLSLVLQTYVRSIETKLVRFYQANKSFRLLDELQPLKTVSLEILFGGVQDLSGERSADFIIQDYRINKLKGFFYGFYSGDQYTITHTNALIYSFLYKVLNIASAVFNKKKELEIFQKEQLNNAVFEWVNKTSKHGNNVEDISNFLCNSSLRNEVVLINLINLMQGVLTKSYNIYDLVIYIENGLSGDYRENFIDCLNKISDNLLVKNEINLNNPPIIINDNGNIKIRYDSDFFINSNQIKLFEHLINDNIAEIGKTAFSTFSSSLKPKQLNEIGHLGKKIFLENWTNCIERDFLLNKLGNSLINGTKLDVAYKDTFLYSLASVLLFNSSNPFELIKQMRNQGLSIYGYSCGLFGSICGYANLSRDFIECSLLKAINFESFYKVTSILQRNIISNPKETLFQNNSATNLIKITNNTNNINDFEKNSSLSNRDKVYEIEASNKLNQIIIKDDKKILNQISVKIQLNIKFSKLSIKDSQKILFITRRGYLFEISFTDLISNVELKQLFSNLDESDEILGILSPSVNDHFLFVTESNFCFVAKGSDLLNFHAEKNPFVPVKNQHDRLFICRIDDLEHDHIVATSRTGRIVVYQSSTISSYLDYIRSLDNSKLHKNLRIKIFSTSLKNSDEYSVIAVENIPQKKSCRFYIDDKLVQPFLGPDALIGATCKRISKGRQIFYSIKHPIYSIPCRTQYIESASIEGFIPSSDRDFNYSAAYSYVLNDNIIKWTNKANIIQNINL